MKAAKIIILVGTLVISGLFISLIATPKNASVVEVKHKYDYDIIKKWNVPGVLEEISGIFWLGDEEVAAIQDEDGVVFVYNMEREEMKEEIGFDRGGDYEAVAVFESTAYVLRSDGLLIEISNYTEDDRSVKTYQSFFDQKNDMEAMTFDKKNKRLLFMAKDNDPFLKDEKGIYAFNIDTKEFNKKAVISLDLKSEALKDYKHKDSYKTLRPSDLAIHPKTGEIYIVEGIDPKIVIIDTSGKVKSVYPLDEDDFEQPEGITFDEDGHLYVSNEAVSHSANIIQIELQDKNIK